MHHHHASSCRIMPRHVSPCLIKPRPASSCPIMPYHAPACLAMPQPYPHMPHPNPRSIMPCSLTRLLSTMHNPHRCRSAVLLTCTSTASAPGTSHTCRTAYPYLFHRTSQPVAQHQNLLQSRSSPHIRILVQLAVWSWLHVPPIRSCTPPQYQGHTWNPQACNTNCSVMPSL